MKKGTVPHVLDTARKQIGVKESPPDSNNVFYNTWYYGREVFGKAYPWCMVFVQWVFDQSGVKLPRRTASCGDLMNATKSAGMWVTKEYRPGDVVIYDFPNTSAKTDHCGIVESVQDGTVTAIEGNTSYGNDSNGGAVMRRVRPTSQVVGAVRCKFVEEDDDMTGEQIYKALVEYLAKQPVPNWAKKELEEAKKMGITDGTNPMDLIPRYQAAIMAVRAAKGQNK